MRIRETFVAHDVVDACRGWLEVIGHETTLDAKEAAATEATRSLEQTGFRGTRRIIAASELAILVDERSPGDSDWTGAEYRDVVLSGWLGRVTQLRLGAYVTLSLPVYDASVIDVGDSKLPLIEPNDPLINDDPIHAANGTLLRPLHLPAEYVRYVICAPPA